MTARGLNLLHAAAAICGLAILGLAVTQQAIAAQTGRLDPWIIAASPELAPLAALPAEFTLPMSAVAGLPENDVPLGVSLPDTIFYAIPSDSLLSTAGAGEQARHMPALLTVPNIGIVLLAASWFVLMRRQRT